MNQNLDEPAIFKKWWNKTKKQTGVGEGHSLDELSRIDLAAAAFFAGMRHAMKGGPHRNGAECLGPGCIYCDEEEASNEWTCQRCHSIVPPNQVTFEELHDGCGGRCS